MAPKGDNVVVSNMKLENLLSMKGGKGAASYANNSQAQVIYSILFTLITFLYNSNILWVSFIFYLFLMVFSS